jgi:beta-carotene ketolase (CrtO type)
MDERALESSPAGVLAGATLERFADQVWAVAEKALGKPLPLVERRVTGPAAWLARNGNLTANPNHVDMTIDQLLDLRPSPSLSRYSTPIAGLYLSGAGTHPGGGVTGIPGRNAAQALLREIGMKREKRSLAQARERVALMTDAARAARSLWSPWPRTTNSRRMRKGQST